MAWLMAFNGAMVRIRRQDGLPTHELADAETVVARDEEKESERSLEDLFSAVQNNYTIEDDRQLEQRVADIVNEPTLQSTLSVIGGDFMLCLVVDRRKATLTVYSHGNANKLEHCWIGQGMRDGARPDPDQFEGDQPVWPIHTGTHPLSFSEIERVQAALARLAGAFEQAGYTLEQKGEIGLHFDCFD